MIGFTVGQVKFVRVYALVNQIKSVPSDSVSIYAQTPEAVRIAA